MRPYIFEYDAAKKSDHFLIPLRSRIHHLFIDDNQIVITNRQTGDEERHAIQHMILADISTGSDDRAIQFYSRLGKVSDLVCTLNLQLHILEHVAKQMYNTFSERDWYRRSLYKQFCKIIDTPDVGDHVSLQRQAFQELFLQGNTWDDHRRAMFHDYYVKAVKLDKDLPKDQILATQVWEKASELWLGFTDAYVDETSFQHQIIVLLNLCMLDYGRRSGLRNLLRDLSEQDGADASIRMFNSSLEHESFFYAHLYGVPKVTIIAGIVRVITYCCSRGLFLDEVVRTHARKLLVTALNDWYMYEDADVPWDKFALEENGRNWLGHDIVQQTFLDFKHPSTLDTRVFTHFQQLTVPKLDVLRVCASAINAITRLLRACTRIVEEDTVVYRLTNEDNIPKSGLRSVTVIPSKVIMPEMTGTIYTVILRAGVQVITAPLLHGANHFYEFEMIVVDGAIDRKETDVIGGNTLVVRNKEEFEDTDREQVGSKRQRRTEEELTTLFLRLRFA